MTKLYYRNQNYQQVQSQERENLIFGFNLTNSIVTLRIVGYGLLILWLIDIAEVLYPLQLLNPIWSFQVFGQFVERIGVLLISLCFIFFGEHKARTNWELVIVRGLSMLTLITAIAYFLMIPLGIGNTFRIANQTDRQISLQLRENIEQLDRLQEEVATYSDPKKLQQFIEIGDRFIKRTNAKGLTIPELRAEANTQIKQQANEIKLQAQKARRERKVNLLKRSLKWNLGALLSSILLLLVWANNSWASRIK
jgi:hypothetical protein